MEVSSENQTAAVREVGVEERISALPKTLEAEKRELARLAGGEEPFDGRRFQLHAANALYLAQDELERKTNSTGGIENRLPKMSRTRAIRSLMGSEYFDRFCENQRDAEGMARLFQGEQGAINAVRQFGAAIRQVEREKTARQTSPHPAPTRQAEGPLPGHRM